MPISSDGLDSSGHFARYEPFRPQAPRAEVFGLQCHYCGFEPADPLHPPQSCPKCHAQVWERFARPGSLLENAQRQ